jgi:hypothetical protein
MKNWSNNMQSVYLLTKFVVTLFAAVIGLIIVVSALAKIHTLIRQEPEPIPCYLVDPPTYELAPAGE